MRSEALQLSSFFFFKKKRGHPVTRAGGRGFTAKIVVMNGAQRCEMHNRAVCRWVEWERSSVQSPAVAILVKSYSARNFQRPPTHQALYSQRIHLTAGAIGSASAQHFFSKKRRTSCHPGGRAGFHCKDCGAGDFNLVCISLFLRFC